MKILTVLSILILGCLTSQAQETLKVAWSIYPGWMDNALMQMKLQGKSNPSFLEARQKEFGAQVDVQLFQKYIPSVEALASGEVDGATMTLQEATTIVADKGIDVEVIFLHDYSNGNDQVIVPTAWLNQDLKGKTFLGEELSVSQYLFWRYLLENQLPAKGYVDWKNTPGDDVGTAFIAALGKSPVGGVTWNPNCERMLQTGKAKAIFTSRDIPGEITDVFVVRKDRMAGKENAIKAYVAAHFDVMQALTNPATRDKVIRAMASAAGFSPEETEDYARMLNDTRFYTTREEVKTAMESTELPATLSKIEEFYQTYGEPSPEPGVVSFNTEFVK